MLTVLTAVAAALACFCVGVLAGLVTAYLHAKSLVELFGLRENPGAPDGDLVYDWDATIITGDGVVRVPMYDSAGSDAVLELSIDDAHMLGAKLETAALEAPETAGAAVDA